MDPSTFIDPQLTLPDLLVLKNLLKDVESRDGARSVARVETDVVMISHLLLYLTTSVPSALLLYHHFTWLHGIAHWILHVWYAGTYTLMKHQYVHMNGILAPRYYLVDLLFPITTLKGNGPRRSEFDYVANARATSCVFILPLLTLRLGLMVGNWGQHAFVDVSDPTSDFRSSITLIDVASNRFCFNDGYHTSHHLHPRRHWREHPAAFVKQKARYAEERALVFRNIDFLMVTLKLLQKDYMYLAKCLVPIGEYQTKLSLEQRAEMLKSRTRRLTTEELWSKFHKNKLG
ncbi:conserved hypothetical protein [Uncinocarpus reesii 1704]|uniref:Fatty acid desaturase domain-containing protein n=1 Tax=Uncinocarpus reesii (strain UAMH 1704) TaxID=336963 RepID=C4JP81_UNCRE|nr:uncharacterized protein UREG_04463 [Uncinocarpus reesii 1704]EEP79617.1 conserved hypothetical protein [Uncinocarpus reesii 1704]